MNEAVSLYDCSSTLRMYSQRQQRGQRDRHPADAIDLTGDTDSEQNIRCPLPKRARPQAPRPLATTHQCITILDDTSESSGPQPGSTDEASGEVDSFPKRARLQHGGVVWLGGRGSRSGIAGAARFTNQHPSGQGVTDAAIGTQNLTSVGQRGFTNASGGAATARAPRRTDAARITSIGVPLVQGAAHASPAVGTSGDDTSDSDVEVVSTKGLVGVTCAKKIQPRTHTIEALTH